MVLVLYPNPGRMSVLAAPGSCRQRQWTVQGITESFTHGEDALIAVGCTLHELCRLELTETPLVGS